MMPKAGSLFSAQGKEPTGTMFSNQLCRLYSEDKTWLAHAIYHVLPFLKFQKYKKKKVPGRTFSDSLFNHLAEYISAAGTLSHAAIMPSLMWCMRLPSLSISLTRKHHCYFKIHHRPPLLVGRVAQPGFFGQSGWSISLWRQFLHIAHPHCCSAI